MTINYCDKEDRYWIKDGDQWRSQASHHQSRSLGRLLRAVSIADALVSTVMCLYLGHSLRGIFGGIVTDRLR